MDNNVVFNIFDFKEYSQRCLVIRDKNSNLVPFKLNPAQKKLDALFEELEKNSLPIRIIILKARQMGFSTYTEGRILHRTATRKNVKSGIITHKDDATNNLFNMSKRYYDNLPSMLKPTIKASNSKELIFNTKDGKGLDSSIKCMTAGASGVGRSDTYNNLHISELAFWEGNAKETMSGLVQSVPNTPDSMIIIESTANGYNFFKELWDGANKTGSEWNGYHPIFFAWFEHPEYRIRYDGFELTEEEIKLKLRYDLDNEQIAWRRYTINNTCFGDIDMFHQEFPSTPEEAFISTGRTIFNKNQVIDAITYLTKNPLKYKKIYFEYDYDGVEIDTIKVFETKESSLAVATIYEEPKDFYPYVIGVDTALDGEDYAVAQVIDNTNGHQVAIMRLKCDEDFFTFNLYCLGKYYNNALIGIETNLTTYPIKKLTELGYDNQYVRQREDTYTEKLQMAYGFRTTSQTKEIITSNYKRIFREDIKCVVDLETLQEMLVFVRFENGSTGAMQGYHDDCVISMAIGLYLFMSDQQDHEPSAKHETGITYEKHWFFKDDTKKKGDKYLEWD